MTNLFSFLVKTHLLQNVDLLNHSKIYLISFRQDVTDINLRRALFLTTY